MTSTAETEGSTPKTAVLLANLGTPEAPDARGVGRFLREFLGDPRVVDLPRWLWLPLLWLVIVPLRARRSAAAYRKIWLQEGSPLLVFTLRLAEKLSQRLSGKAIVLAGMRYGEPAIATALATLKSKGVQKLVVLPLYPQFSHTTTSSIFDAVDSALQQLDWQPEQIRIDNYHQSPQWIAAVAASITAYRQNKGKADRLLFSLHGIPKRYVQNGDPYEQQCQDSVAGIVRQAGLQDDEWLLTFQSRVGREPWLQPYTDLTLEEFAKQGVKTVQVVCPGFAVDCLETLEEIAMQNEELFTEAGGQTLQYIPALNDSDEHVEVLASLVEPHISLM
ncbi:MAG TPA: ferrochelatase [Xanthomonadales bacterium]|nr:ferrochelatase [Xanthomonadales bacterium]